MEIENLFCKVSNVKKGKVESCSRIKDGNGWLAEEDEVQGIWKEYFENLYNIDTQK